MQDKKSAGTEKGKTSLQLAGELEQILNYVEESDGVLDPETEALLDQITDQLINKLDKVGLHIALTQKEIEGLKEFKQSVDSRKKAIENKLNAFKTYLSKMVRLAGGKNKSGKHFIKGAIVSITDNTKEVIETDIDSLPFELKNKSIPLEIPVTIYDGLKPAVKEFLKKYAAGTISDVINQAELDKLVEKEREEYQNNNAVQSDSLFPVTTFATPGIKAILKKGVVIRGLKKLEVEEK